MTRIVWSFFIIIIAFYNLNDDSAFWKKTQSFLAQKGRFYWATIANQRWKLSKVNFWPKRNMRNDAYIKPLSSQSNIKKEKFQKQFFVGSCSSYSTNMRIKYVSLTKILFKQTLKLIMYAYTFCRNVFLKKSIKMTSS